MKTLLYRKKPTPIRLLVVSLAALGLSHASRAQEGSGLNQLQGLPERVFSKVIRSETAVTSRISDEQLRRKTFVHPEVLLGAHHRLIFVEQTRGDRGTRLKPDRNQPGVRIVEVAFGEKDDSSEELWKRVEEQAIARGLRLHPAPPQLKLNYYDKNSSRSGQNLLVRYDEGDEQFVVEEGSHDFEDEAVSKSWVVTQPTEGELHIQSAQVGPDQAGCRRDYRILQNEKGKFQIAGSVIVGFGSEWSHQIDISLPLPLARDTIKMLAASLKTNSPEFAGISTTDGMLFIPFPRARDRNLNAVAGLAIDLENLELCFLSKLIDDLMDQVRSIQKITAKGVGDEKALKLYREADDGLTLAKAFAGLQEENVKDRRVIDGISDTQGKMSSLVFQFPYVYAGKSLAVSYAPGSETMFLCSSGAQWTTGKETNRPLQFKAPNGTLVFLMHLSEAQPVILSREEEKDLCSEMGASFGMKRLENSTVKTRLPKGRLDLDVSEDGSEVSKIASLKIRNARIDPFGRMVVSLSAAEVDSFRLLDLYLKKNGLPAAFDVRQFLMGGGGLPLLAAGNHEPVKVICAIKEEKGFDVVTESKKSIDVTVMVSEEIFTRLNQETVTVKLRYPDDREERYSIPVTSEQGEASIEMEMRYSGGRVEAGVNYSVDGQTWKLAEDGLYGFIYIES